MSEQKKIAENLRKTEMEYKIATQHSGRTICRFDVASRNLTIAAEDAKYFSLPECIPDVPYGRVRLGKISSDTAGAYIGFYEDIIKGKKEGKVIFEKRLAVGWRWISAHSTTIFSENGQPISAIISYVDITEQQEKEDVFHKWQQSFDNRSPESYTFFRCNLSKNISDDSFEGKLLRFDHVPDPEATFDERTVDYATNNVFQEDIQKYIETVKSDRLIAEFYRGNRKLTMDYREILPDDLTQWIHMTIELVEQPFSKNIMAYLMFERSKK